MFGKTCSICLLPVRKCKGHKYRKGQFEVTKSDHAKNLTPARDRKEPLNHRSPCRNPKCRTCAYKG